LQIPLLPETLTTLEIRSTEHMMLKMIHDYIAIGVTKMVLMVAVLLCGNKMKRLPHYYCSWIVSFHSLLSEYCPLYNAECYLNSKHHFKDVFYAQKQ